MNLKFDIFYQLPAARTQTVANRYRELVAEAAEADRLGFNTLWLAEVHFAPRFSVMPTPLLLHSAIALRTERLGLGIAVNLLPLHHPMRLAEEAATLDVLSGGRLEFGAGRGAFPLNYRGYGVDVEMSRAVFAEELEFIKRAWTEQRLSFRGEHFRAEDIEVVPKPAQRPHPPIRLAANSNETFTFAAENGYPIFAGGPVSPIPILGEKLAVYRQALDAAGRKQPDDWLAALSMMFVGRDRASVRSIIEPSLRNYFEVVGAIAEPQTLALAKPQDFERVRSRLVATPYETIDQTMGIFGDPEYCVDRITELRERFGFSRLVCWFEIGGLAGHENILAAMRLFAERVMPRFA